MNCKIFKEYKEAKPLKFKSKRQAKKEKERYSVFYKDLTKCCLNGTHCGHVDKHEVFLGRNRSNSIKYGFVLPLCRDCHTKYNEDYEFIDNWKVKAQKYFEKNIGSREEFIKIFGRNYIK